MIIVAFTSEIIVLFLFISYCLDWEHGEKQVGMKLEVRIPFSFGYIFPV